MTIFVATAVLSALLCAGYIRLARRRNILDHPNARSSHAESTPHGGGVPLFIAFAAGLAYAFFDGAIGDLRYALLALSALLLVVVGIIDDLHDLSVRARMSLYAALVLTVVVLLLAGFLLPLSVQGLALLVCASLAVLWLLNLYNFMDGIDGIAALQGVVSCIAAAWLSGDAQYSVFCLLIAAALAGFLFFNLPPARLFMGDAGSIPTGFLLGALAILGSVESALNPLAWLILLALFITDATWTLVWRMATGQAYTEAHRLHAYQRLAAHWKSHARVDGVFLMILIVWLVPLAWLVNSLPGYDLILVILAYLPLLFGMAKIRNIN